MNTFVDKLPTLLFSSAKNLSSAKQISRLAKSGKIRRIYAGVYTTDLKNPIETITRQNWSQIVGHLYPGAVVGYRSAQLGMPDSEGNIYIVNGKYTRRIDLPGLQIQLIPGNGPITNQLPSLNDTPYGLLYVSSEPRRILENLYARKNSQFRTLGREWVESYLNTLCTIRGDHKLNELRAQAKSVSELLGLTSQFKVLNEIISALLGTGNAKTLRAKDAIARASGKPFDPFRIELFDVLFTALRKPFKAIPTPYNSPQSFGNFAFYESYFSNFIEGTTFTVDEATQIIFDGKMIPLRNEDSHDILGTYQAIINDSKNLLEISSEDAFLDWIQTCNYDVLSSRPDKKPGQWKEISNQAGNTIFVHPELVKGTLKEGFKRIQLLEDPFAKALMAMFIVTEVHPFMDGNGRTARLLMNAYLSQASACRIIIPTAYREDYLLPLKALSMNHNAEPFLRSMIRIQLWTSNFDYQDFAKLSNDLKNCNAFAEDINQRKLLNPQDLN